MSIWFASISAALGIIVIIRKKHQEKHPQPIKNITQALERAFNYNKSKNYNKALDILHEGLNLDRISDAEKGELWLRIAFIYISQGDYYAATSYFDKAFYLTMNERFNYHKDLHTIIDAYVQANRLEDAKLLTQNLIKRQYYDSRFKNLESLLNELKSYT